MDQGASLKFPVTGVELNQVPFLSYEPGFNYSTIEQGGALTLSPHPYPTDIVAPLPFTAEDEATLLWSAAGLGNTSFHSADDTSETSPSTLLSAPYGYHSKTSSPQSVLFTGFNSLKGIHTNSHPGCSRFSGLSGSQTAFGTDNWPAEVGECSQSYPAANLVSVNSRPVWDANAHSSSSADPVNLWTAPLMNGDPDSNHAPIHGFQSMNDPNVNHDFAFGPMADTQDFTEPYLTPSLDYHVADSNINSQSTRFEASNGTMFNRWLGYNPAPAIADELLSQNALRNMEPEVLPENNDSFPQARAGSPGEAISSEISPANHDDHERVKPAVPSACMECGQSFRTQWQLDQHCNHEAHAGFMCKCGKGYTRLDVLGRHLKAYQPDLRKYTCSLCNSHSGGKSFTRKDHLTQHIRGYHHIGNHDDVRLYLCAHSDCLQYREPNFCDLTKEIQLQNRPFANLKEFVQHMRTVHNEAPYPCDVSGCLRAGGKGYYSRMGLIKHRKREHPDVPKVKVLLSCRLPGCSGNGENGIINHYMKDHGYSWDFAEGLTNGWTAS